MANLKSVVEGIKTLSKYYTNGLDSYEIESYDDMIMLGATNKRIKKSDINKMWKLGWSQPTSQKEGDYDPEEMWRIWV